MPLFEYVCHSCDAEFEMLVGQNESVRCPHCESRDLEKLMSAASARVSGGALPLASACPPPEAGPCSPTCCRLPSA
jgi:putative FmdB family regulatory protein